LSPDDAARRLGVDPAVGLSAAKAAELLNKNGPNALPAEKAVPEWRRFVDQCRSYVQIILLIAAVASLAIGQWSTGAVLLLLTVFNAVVGLRQERKAERAMNALKSLTKNTARVRRDGVEAAIPAEEVVIGDVVLLSAGDDVAADKEALGLMSLKPQSRDASIMTRGLLTTARSRGPVRGRVHARADQLRQVPLRQRRRRHVDGVTAFSLLLIASAFEARSVTAHGGHHRDLRQPEHELDSPSGAVLAVLITQVDVMRRLFGTVQLSLTQWALALVPAAALSFLWELGKLIARLGADRSKQTMPAEAAAV